MACDTGLRLAVPADLHGFEVELADADAYARDETAGWGAPAEQVEGQRRALRVALTIEPRTAHFFGARLGGETVGTAGVFLRGDYGYLVGGQVREAARARGAYRVLIAERLAFLRARAIDLAVTHASEETSAPMLEHLGFETLFRFESLRFDP